MKDEIDKSRNELQDVQKDLRKQSARLKKQAARMTETHNRRKKALAEERKQIVNDVNIEKKQWKGLYPVCREEDEVFTQTVAERAYDVASLEPRGRATLRRFSVGCTTS